MRMWPNTEAQAKVAIAILLLIIVVVIGGMAFWFGLRPRDFVRE